MEKQTPQTFQEWKTKRGKESWYEVPVSIAMKLSGVPASNIAIKKAIEQISSVLAHKLFEMGAELESPNVETWREAYHHVDVINADVKSSYVCMPEQYLYMAYHNWEKEYDKRVDWENKSLLSYIKHWIKRKAR